MTESGPKHSLGFSLLQKLCREEKGNFVFSPLSLGTAFAMLCAGLRGDTKTEVLKLLGTLDEGELHSMYGELLSKNLPLALANKYLADKDCVIHQQFDSLLKEKYESEVECVSFGKAAGDIESEVNEWVAKKTHGMIPKLLSEGTLNRDTVLVLLNAIYFKGSWFEEFDPVPGLASFSLRSGETIQRCFITKASKRLVYSETNKLRVVKIPYQEAGFYMLVAIPKDENEHIDEVMAGVKMTELISASHTSRHRGKVILRMPKFKIEYSFDKVKESLKELGVNKIFVPDVGDFGDLFVKVRQSPFVGAIIHKAVIEVDEKGTTAAAATAMTVCVNSLPPPPIFVNLDRPFCFLIMSTDDIVCFAGICAQP